VVSVSSRVVQHNLQKDRAAVYVFGCTGSETSSFTSILEKHSTVQAVGIHDLSSLNFLPSESKFIFLLRDPRDVFAASKLAFGSDFTTFREEWEKSLLHAHLLKLRLGTSRVREVEYQALQNDPKGALRKIFEFVQLAYTDQTFSDDEVANLIGPHVNRQALSQEENDAVCRRLHGLMRHVGYLAYEEYEQISRDELRKVDGRRSKTLARSSADQCKRGRTMVDLERLWNKWIDVPPVFIVGHGRSGTTLLKMMLTAHPSISISSEGAYVCPLRSRISAYGDLREIENLDSFRMHLLPWLTVVNYLNPPTTDDLAAFAEKFGCDERAFITFLGTWEAAILGKQQLKWWGDNEPTHVFNIPYFRKLFPSSKFIFMIRDPRDVFASFKAAWPKAQTAESLSMRWERCLLDGLVAASCLGDSAVKQMKYEDLVTNPSARLEEICGFLSVEYTDAMLNFHETKPAKNLSQVAHHRNVVKPVFTDSVGKYHRILSPQEIATIEQRLCIPMRYFGYLSDEEYAHAFDSDRQSSNTA
jgi:Sulfotransferase family